MADKGDIDCLRCSQEDRIREIHEMIRVLDEHIRGNGKPGLTTQVAVLSLAVKGMIGLCVIIITGLVGVWLKTS